MFIYTYENIYKNHLSGYFYFGADNVGEVKRHIKAFEKEHYDERDAYRIKLKFVDRIKAKPGYLSLNRSFFQKK